MLFLLLCLLTTDAGSVNAMVTAQSIDEEPDAESQLFSWLLFGSNRHRLVVEYSIAGRTYSSSLLVSASTYEQQPIGSTISIRSASMLPKAIVLHDDAPPLHLLVLTLVAVAFAGSIFVNLVTVRAQEQELYRRGIAVSGTITRMAKGSDDDHHRVSYDYLGRSYTTTMERRFYGGISAYVVLVLFFKKVR